MTLRLSLSVGVISGGTFVNTVPIECRAQVLAVMQTQETFEEICARMLALQPMDPDVEFVVEQRQPMLHASQPTSIANCLIERVLCCGGTEHLAITAAETFDAVFVEQRFARR